MSDYKEMYLTLFRATDQALDILIGAQQACEELYLAEPAAALFPLGGEKEPDHD